MARRTPSKPDDGSQVDPAVVAFLRDLEHPLKFATFHLRATDRVRLILHLGAKVRETATTGVKVADPAGLLEWLAKDRCSVAFSDGKELQARGAAFQALLREWIRWV